MSIPPVVADSVVLFCFFFVGDELADRPLRRPGVPLPFLVALRFVLGDTMFNGFVVVVDG